MTFLTIFTSPKPFTDPHIATIQRNAIRSWQSLGEEVEVLLIGEEPGIAEAAVDLAKQRELSGMAREYLRRVPGSPPWRFDVVSIYQEEGAATDITLFRNAFLIS